MVTGGGDNTVRVWDVPTGRELSRRTEHTDYVSQVCFLDDRRFLSASDDRRVLLWTLDSEVPVRTFAGHKGEIVSLAIAPDGRRFGS
jgi:WD40 repeat protein